MGKTEKTYDPKEWVIFSAYLDLWQDEEGNTIDDVHSIISYGTNAAELEEWFSQVRRTSPLRRYLVETLPPRTIFPELLGPEDPKIPKQLWSTFSKGAVPDQVWNRFWLVKSCRVAANLAYSRRCYVFSESRSLYLDQDWRRVVETYRTRVDWLDRVRDFSMAALYYIDRRRRAREGRRREWDTLWMLFHSELCASASSDVSLAHAMAMSAGHDGDETELRELFEDVVRHNRARGHNHQGHHSEAATILELWIDEYMPSSDERYETLRKRFVYFPAILTLADALEHMQRCAEAVWYLKHAAIDAVPDTYWSKTLALQLLRLRAAAELSTADVNRPRLHHLHYQVLARYPDTIIAAQSADVADKWREWCDALLWTLRWHFASSEENFLRRIQGTAEDVCRVAEAVKGQQERGQNIALRKVLDGAGVLLDALASFGGTAKNTVKFLAPAAEGPELPPRKDHPRLWDTIAPLLHALDEVRGGEDPWTKALRKRVKDNVSDLQATVARSAIIERLAPEIEDMIHRSECPLNPNSTQTCRHGSHGCAVASLFRDEAPDGAHSTLATLDYMLTTMATYQERYYDYLHGYTAEYCAPGDVDNTTRYTPDVEFVSLRRWNSFSPNLNSLSTVTVGGGYLVRVWDEDLRRYVGVAVDPGYNYLQNLFNEGFTVGDLDVVVITHAHPDHTDNISNLLTLLREQKKRRPHSGRSIQPSVCFIITAGVFHRLQSLLINEKDFISDIVVLSWKDSPGNLAGQRPVLIGFGGLGEAIPSLQYAASPGDHFLSITAIPAFHADSTRRDSMGVTIDAKGTKITILSDSRYIEKVLEGTPKTDLVVAHVGAILDEKQYENAHTHTAERRELSKHLNGCLPGGSCHSEQDCARQSLFKNVLLKKNHLYLPGLTKLLCNLSNMDAPPLVVLSEFGEELRGGLRVDLASRMTSLFSNGHQGYRPVECIAADVGLRIDVKNRTIRCVICRRYSSFQKTDSTVASPSDEAISYICSDCQNLRKGELPELIVQTRMHPKQLSKR